MVVRYLFPGDHFYPFLYRTFCYLCLSVVFFAFRLYCFFILVWLGGVLVSCFFCLYKFWPPVAGSMIFLLMAGEEGNMCPGGVFLHQTSRFRTFSSPSSAFYAEVERSLSFGVC